MDRAGRGGAGGGGGFAETLFEAAGVVGGVSAGAAGRMRAAGWSAVTAAGFCVLGSSSSGNCSVLRVGDRENYRLVLIDCGFSPTRTRKLLAEAGFDVGRVSAVVLTHLHRDHVHEGWVRKLPRAATFWVSRSHLRFAERAGVTYRRTEVFGWDEPFSVCGVSARAVRVPHDDQGAAALRFEVETAAGEVGTLGYATDMGRVLPECVELLRGVDVLAIESNYCPEMQLNSGRHGMLIGRVMNGGGHLSNAESAAAAIKVGPRRVILLHLSRDCNDVELALSEHAGGGYEVEAAPAVGPGQTIELV